jgi:hypothetical protein
MFMDRIPIGARAAAAWLIAEENACSWRKG